MFALSASAANMENHTIINIKTSRSEIKVHSTEIGPSRVTPELFLKGCTHKLPNDDLDKVSQALNRLKISALSKAIAMAPQVDRCSFSPTNRSPMTPEPDPSLNRDSDALNISTPKIKNAITSTPLKSNKFKDIHNESTEVKSAEPERSVIDVSEIKLDGIVGKSVSSHLDDINELEILRVKLLNKIEIDLLKSVVRKKEQYSKKFIDNDEMIKEKSVELKLELERERIIRSQEHYHDAQKAMIEAKENALKFQELQQSKFDHDKRIADTNERIRQNELKRKELEDKHKKKREELKRCIDGIYEVQIAYRKKYNHITEITKKCKNIKLLNEKVSDEIPKLKGLNEVILKLVEKSKEGKVSLQDLSLSQGLLQQIDIICELFARHSDDVNRYINDAEESKKKNEKLESELKAKKEEIVQQNKLAENKHRVELNKSETSAFNLSSEVEDCVSVECLQIHKRLSTYLGDYEKKLQPLLQEDSLKKFRLECQKVVNVPVNAISPLDDLHLQDKLYKLSRMLRGEPVPLGQTMFLPTGHPLGIAYCTYLLAKKFVTQGEHTVSSKPEAAFAIASVIVALWVDFPEFGQLLMAHFHCKCPYLIPAFMPQLEGQSNEDYYRTLGYQFSEEGKVETQDQFLRRMSGVARLYAAIMVTPLRCTLSARHLHPHGLREAWRWMAATINLKPRPDISATLLFDVLEVTGNAMFRTYGLQFTKLIHVLCADYFPIIQQVTPDGCGGPVVRLKSFLEKFLKEGQILPPSGRLPPNFW